MFAAYYGIIVGFLMFAQWGFFLASGQVPEVQTEPIRLAFHLAAEFITAAGLIATGFGLFKKYSWAKTGFLISTGMVIYSEIVSPGYFAQQGQWIFVIMFAVLLAGAVIAAIQVIRSLVK
jgi:hypothetical protein